MSAELTDAENMAIGAIAATFCVGALQPTIFMKNAMAQGKPPSLDPRVLYRGVGINLGNEMGQMSLQFGVTGFLKRVFRSDAVGELSAAASAGALVALFASPCELVMIQQQLHGGGLLNTAANIVRKFGATYALQRGLALAMARDALMVGGMLGATPVVHSMLVNDSRSGGVGIGSTNGGTSGGTAGGGDGSGSGSTGRGGRVVTGADATLLESSSRNAAAAAAASLAASMLGGIFGAVFSQPLDVLSTCMKGDLEKRVYGGVRDTMRALYEEGGLRRLMSGGMWRCANITATVWIANECALRLPSYVTFISREWLADRAPARS